jgi:hypothetical protein
VSDDFAADATWWMREGLADSSWISLKSYNQTNSYLGKQFGVMALFALSDSTSAVVREGATFQIIED